MLDLPEGSIIMDEITSVKYLDEEGVEHIESFYGSADGSPTDYGEVLKMIEALRFTVWSDMFEKMFMPDEPESP